MDNHYGGVIWTNHALERMSERGIKQGDALVTFQSPQQSRPGSAPESWVYYRTYGEWKIEVVAKQNEKKEWIILSVWSRPAGQYSDQTSSKKFTFLDLLWRLIFGKK